MVTVRIIGTVIPNTNERIMEEKVIYAMYDDDDVLKDGARSLVDKVLILLMCIHLCPYME